MEEIVNAKKEYSTDQTPFGATTATKAEASSEDHSGTDCHHMGIPLKTGTPHEPVFLFINLQR